MQQQQVIGQQSKTIEELTQAVNQLKVSQGLDSQTSSKPPSTDLLKKSEKAKESSKVMLKPLSASLVDLVIQEKPAKVLGE